VFSSKGAKRDKWRGPKGRADALAIVVLWRKEDRAARLVGPSPFLVASDQKTPNSSPRRLAIGCFQGNQNVTLLSTVLVRATAFQQTVLPPSRALKLCALARKPLKMTDISKAGSRNMAETCAINFFYSGFLFDFYSDMGSTATPSVRSNVSWCGLGIFLGRNGVV